LVLSVVITDNPVGRKGDKVLVRVRVNAGVGVWVGEGVKVLVDVAVIEGGGVKDG
jgi:hypothetical protein